MRRLGNLGGSAKAGYSGQPYTAIGVSASAYRQWLAGLRLTRLNSQLISAITPSVSGVTGICRRNVCIEMQTALASAGPRRRGEMKLRRITALGEAKRGIGCGGRRSARIKYVVLSMLVMASGGVAICGYRLAK